MLTKMEQIARDLGTQMLQWREKPIGGTWEASQLKTQADMDAHAFLVISLQKAFPGLPVISEEDASLHTHERPEKYFIIDPIDGTASFAGGFDGFVTQMAYMEQNQPVCGVVYAPALDELFSAEKDKGATKNGNPLTLPAIDGRRLLVDNYPEPRGIAQKAYEALDCTGYVECGSLGLKTCKIADGTADIFIKDVELKDWDMAPADLILSESGGNFSLLSGEEYSYTGSYYKHGIQASRNVGMAQLVVDFSNSL